MLNPTILIIWKGTLLKSFECLLLSLTLMGRLTSLYYKAVSLLINWIGIRWLLDSLYLFLSINHLEMKFFYDLVSNIISQVYGPLGSLSSVVVIKVRYLLSGPCKLTTTGYPYSKVLRVLSSVVIVLSLDYMAVLPSFGRFLLLFFSGQNLAIWPSFLQLKHLPASFSSSYLVLLSFEAL